MVVVMDQCNMNKLEDVVNGVLNELGLSTLDKAMLSIEMHEGENHNCTLDKDVEISQPMRTWNKLDHHCRQQMTQIHRRTDSTFKNNTTDDYQMHVESNFFSTLEVEHESLSDYQRSFLALLTHMKAITTKLD